MKLRSLLLPNLRKGIVHFIVGIIAVNILLDIYSSPFTSQWKLYVAIVIVLAFYIHTLVLLPLLTIRKKPRPYLIYTLIGFFFFAYLANWFEAVRSSEIIFSPGGTRFSPSHFFFQPDWFFGVLVAALLVFIPLFLLSFIYHTFLISKQDRTRIFSLRYMEVSANVVIGMSLLLLVLASSINNEHAIQKFIQFLTFATAFYLNTFVLIPKLLSKKRFLAYAISLILLFVGFLLVKPLFQDSVVIFNIEDRYYIFGSVILFFVAIFLSFIYDYVRSKIKAREQLFSLKLSSKESELQLLKSQVNPHFLFNTLNTLYATSLKENAPKTAQSIAKLGSLIRYMQNDIDKDFIPLQKEVDYLKDYIEIQKLRLAIEPEIITSFENIESQMMSPGLFIPLVENAFKYGIHPTEKSTIRITVQCDENTIAFSCENNYDPDQIIHHMNKGFGIGINNVQQRLELVYPEKHTFHFEKTDSKFVVKLTLNLS